MDIIMNAIVDITMNIIDFSIQYPMWTIINLITHAAVGTLIFWMIRDVLILDKLREKK